ncbi:MAG: hypothetical protein IH987_10235 [Planctomycetes bacterium]|nr:hypothetical protein [Planctomycetota bacterium]
MSFSGWRRGEEMTWRAIGMGRFRRRCKACVVERLTPAPGDVQRVW